MKHCPNPDCTSRERYEVVAEFLDDADQCHHCGEALAEGKGPALSERAGADWQELVQVESFLDVHSAYATQGALRAAGIDAFVKDEHVAGRRWDYAIALGGIRLLVPEDDLDEARKLVAGVEPGEVESAALASEVSELRCPRCRSHDVSTVVRGRVPSILAILLLGIPLLFLRSRIVCSSCAAEYTP